MKWWANLITQSGKQIFCPIDKEFEWANQRQKFPKIKAKPNIKDEIHGFCPVWPQLVMQYLCPLYF